MSPDELEHHMRAVDDSLYPELLRELAYSIGLVLGGGTLGAIICYIYYGFGNI